MDPKVDQKKGYIIFYNQYHSFVRRVEGISMNEEMGNKCAGNINSIASLDISRRDLIRLRDRIRYLDGNLRDLESSQAALQQKTSKMIKDIERLNSLFISLFGEQIGAISLSEQTEMAGEEILHGQAPPEQIRLALSEPDWEQVRSIMDAIRRVSEEIQGPAPKEIIVSRVLEAGIDEERLEAILGWLKRSGALAESGGMIRLL